MIQRGGSYIIGCFTIFWTTLISALKWNNVYSVCEYLSKKEEEVIMMFLSPIE